MSSQYYEEKIINKNNAFIKEKILKWTVKVLNEKNSHFIKNQYIDILLNHLSKLSIRHLFYRYIELKIGMLENKYSGHENIPSYDTISSLKERVKFKSKKVTMHSSDYPDLLEFLGENWNNPIMKSLKESILSIITNSLKKNLANIDNEPFILRLKKLQKTFKLTIYEINCLILYYAIDQDANFDILLNPHGNRSLNFQDKANRLKLFTDITQSEANKIFYKNSPLRNYKLITDRDVINHFIVEYLSGFSNTHLSSIFYNKFKDKSLPLNSHSIRKSDNKIIKNIIKNKGNNKGVNILLYGVAGTGKTEYTRSIANHLKLELFELNSESYNEESNSQNNGELNRYTAFVACQNTIPQKNSMILVDEADEMLNGGSSAGGFLALFGGGSTRNTEKNKINELLDNSVTVNFWITNHFSNIDDSTLRRFDYSIEFEKFDFKQRLTVWNTVLNKYELTAEFPKKEIKRYAEQYEFNAGGIDIVLKNYKRMPKKSRNEETLKSLIEPHLKLMNMNSDNNNNENKHLKPVKNYSLKGLNIKGEHSISDGLEIITEFSNFMKTDEYKDTEMRNMNLLLHGPSGTGKTEFVKYLAKKTGRELLFKSGSDFLGMYVGQTEQNIKNAFKEAEKKSAILFIDEADGLLFDRSKSTRSFEMTQVNEMLVQMENFNGILICSSNFQKNMDSATYRRFNLKFEFDYLTRDGNSIFYKTILGDLISSKLAVNEKRNLLKIKGLTPGDFKVVKQKYSFFNKKKISHKFLIKALEEEVRYKDIGSKKKFGFMR